VRARTRRRSVRRAVQPFASERATDSAACCVAADNCSSPLCAVPPRLWRRRRRRGHLRDALPLQHPGARRRRRSAQIPPKQGARTTVRQRAPFASCLHSLPPRSRAPPRAPARAQVMIWDDHQGRCIGELAFRSEARPSCARFQHTHNTP
jgi:hypothetical protein